MDYQITCTNINCPERTGGKCNAADNIDPNLIVNLFLEESNKIEGVFDEDALQQAKYAWEFLISQDRLTAGAVLKTHKILMLHQKLRPNEKGYWRMIEVGIYKGGQLIKSCDPWRSIPDSMKLWVEAVNSCIGFYRGHHFEDVERQKKQITESRIKNDHVSFEKVHPFVDGNGRVGRMLMNWTRQKCGMPILVIFDDDKQNYYDWFRV
jgi:Fic family protein